MTPAFNFHALLATLLAMPLLCCVSAQPAVTKTADKSTLELTFTPSSIPESTLSGQVFKAGSQVVLPGIQIALTDYDKGLFLSVITDDEGRFTFKGLDFGGYHLEINAPGYMRVSERFQIKEHVRILADVRLLIWEIQTEKPIIYLYPTEKQAIHVQLDFDGALTHTYPKYPADGWKVTAEPNGRLFDENNQEYYALFWEGHPNTEIIPHTGFVVPGQETAAFLEEKLAYLGLNRREANEFIMYWLPRMEDHAYNFIHFASESYEAQAALHIVPEPETVIRVMMLTQPLAREIEFPEQDLRPLHKVRQGYTVVEWGGSVIHTVNDDL